MKKNTLRHSLLLLLTAAIWGFAFVAQSVPVFGSGQTNEAVLARAERRIFPGRLHSLPGVGAAS